MLLPPFTCRCTCLIAWCALRPGRKPKLDSEKVGVEYRREHLGYCLLDDPVLDRRYAQHAFAAAGFGYFYPAHGLRLVSPVLDLLPISSTRGGQLATTLGLGILVEPIRVMSSSICTARGADLPR